MVNEMQNSMAKECADTVALETETKDLNPGQVKSGGGWFGWCKHAESAMIAMEGKSPYRVVRPVQALACQTQPSNCVKMASGS